ncbi:SMP-30/gluconolactonase/LRE family protein [Echinicola sp. 20G]|uniref:SMP-30/gluconolactonase/LRE family protein n=1 Tax=Echinicola sp. 20G TaxID=2781961 RepID=UPI001910D5BF|nr:SMP-30/gluconolactonase/LRE family protein [Echinicola sp. 20G]
MKYLLYTCLFWGLVSCAAPQESSTQSDEANPSQTDLKADRFSVEIMDKAALEIIDSAASIQVMASGFIWTEGPLWIEEGQYLLFSDIPQNKIFKMSAKGDTSTYLLHSGFAGEGFYSNEPGSNALLLNDQDELVLMQHGERRVAKMKTGLDAPKASFGSLADNYQGQRLNSPNDGVFDAAGNLYFTDPPYGLPPEYAGKELSFQGIYCLKNTGELVLMDSLSRPNGIDLSPDGRKLYVANSDEKHAVWYQYDVVEAGKVNNKKLFYEVTDLIQSGGGNGLPDGLEVSREGFVFATGPGGLWIFSPEGKALARIHTGQLTSNIAFTPDQKQIYLTAHQDILRVDLK